MAPRTPGAIQVARYRRLCPWWEHLRKARERCNNPRARKYENYGGRGIRCRLTIYQVAKLWFRDNAESLRRPSIDRIDSDKDYTLENCRFIELHQNSSAPHVRRREYEPPPPEEGPHDEDTGD